MNKDSELLQIIETVLHDPMLLMKLSDRIYQRIQKEYRHEFNGATYTKRDHLL